MLFLLFALIVVTSVVVITLGTTGRLDPSYIRNKEHSGDDEYNQHFQSHKADGITDLEWERRLKKDNVPMDNKCVLVTAVSNDYVDALLTQIASVHRKDVHYIIDAILVYSLNLTEDMVHKLKRLERVYVMEFPNQSMSFPEMLDPKQYAYKFPIVKDAMKYAENVFWLDAGAMFLQDPKIVFDIIEKDDVFLVQDCNVNYQWTHDRCASILKATEEEMKGKQLCAGITGFKRNGKFMPMLEDVVKYSGIKDCIQGPHSIKNHPTLLGHRHDQSILSIMYIRYQAPVQPLIKFGEFRKELAFDPTNDVVIYVHRRGYSDQSGLRKESTIHKIGKQRLRVKIFTDHETFNAPKIFRRLYPHERVLYVTDNIYDVAVILNANTPDVRVPKERVIGLAFEPVEFLRFAPYSFSYYEKRVGLYCLGYREDHFPLCMQPHYQYFWHETPDLSTVKPWSQRKTMSIITTKAKAGPGHLYRNTLAIACLEAGLDVDVWGYGADEIRTHPNNKGRFKTNEPYSEYKFILAIENFSSKRYISEKFTNAIGFDTVPIYWGGTEVDDVFGCPTHIKLTMNLEEDLNLIRAILENPDKFRLDISSVREELYHGRGHFANLLKEKEFIKTG